jgi:eukaryotic-like serine/threonine-protein kinase
VSTSACGVCRPAPRVSEAATSRTSHTLSPELLGEAARRIGFLGLLYAVAWLVAWFGRRGLLALTGVTAWHLSLLDLFGVAAIGLGLGVYIISQRRLLPPTRLLDLGLVFEVVGAALIAGSALAAGVVPVFDRTIALIPGECIWIIICAVVVPGRPRRVLIASLLAASAGPLWFVLATRLHGDAIDRPLVVASYFLTSNYLSALIAYLVSRHVHRMTMQVKHANDIGSYQLVERIGIGGMGEVWRAKHRLLVRPAAIKLIRRDVIGSRLGAYDATLRRFEREAQETALLGSPHTVTVYDFGVTEEGDFYYVMELLDGMSLERCVRLFGPVEPGRAVALLRQVCHSLGEAHERGLIHRDLKPANIFTCRLGPDIDFIKVLDFGLVKHVDASREGTMLTSEGSTAGTPAYMAPEVATGRRDVDARSDIYSLGCVAYYLLTGQPVFTGDTPIAVALAHVKDAPVPPRLRSEFNVPTDLDALVLECLEKDPSLRPASAAALADRLTRTATEDLWTPEAARRWWDLHKEVIASDRGGGGRGEELYSGAAENAGTSRALL